MVLARLAVDIPTLPGGQGDVPVTYQDIIIYPKDAGLSEIPGGDAPEEPGAVRSNAQFG